jgi:peptidoglycan hydrolase-like protein with peptidoglycan-binding domain
VSVRILAVLVAAAVALACQTRRIGREDPREEGRAAPSKAPAPKARTGAPVPATPQSLLADGAARRIQEALRDRGYLDAVRGDELDEATSAALRQFQSDEGLAATGFPDRETVRQLNVDPTEVYRDREDAAAAPR